MKRLGQLVCIAAIFGLVFQVLDSVRPEAPEESHSACASHEEGSNEGTTCPMEPLHNHCGTSCHHFLTAISWSLPSFHVIQPDLIQMLDSTSEMAKAGFPPRLFIPPRAS
jgi:hypothetical protein